MKKKLVTISLWLVLNALFTGCFGKPSGITSALGQEFTLTPGDSAMLTGENLTITFEEIIEDSRCPKNVTCIWEGRVSAMLTVEKNGNRGQTVLTAPGLTSGPFALKYEEYTLTFQVNPYPEAGKTINKGDYKLVLTVARK